MCHVQSLHLHQVLGNGLPMMEWMTMNKIPCWGNPWQIGHPPRAQGPTTLITTSFARSRFCFSCCKMDAHSCHRGFGQHFCMCVLYVLYSCLKFYSGENSYIYIFFFFIISYLRIIIISMIITFTKYDHKWDDIKTFNVSFIFVIILSYQYQWSQI
jgi:hypothetical protein